MANHHSVGRLGLFAVSILVLSSACAVGEIGGGPGGSRFGSEDDFGPSPVEPSDPAALSCAGARPDVAARDGWRSSDADEPATGALSFELKARPTAANLDGLVAVGAESIDEFDKAAITVRFADSGLVDVRDGAFYASDTRYPYKPGVWYSIAVSADIENKTYDVEIGPCGEPREKLIKGAAFRNGATVIDELGTWAVWSSQSASLEVSTPAWMPSATCVPATCESLGHECGQPSDGCGGVLDCGGCANDKLCDSGLCAEGLVSRPASPGCVPDTCNSLYRECGALSDGCGGTLSCGTCGTGDRCTGWGTCVAAVSKTTPSACTPDTCDSSFRECGVASDACGGTLSCGTCGAGETCTSLGSCVAVVAPAPPTCTPSSCQSLGRECGSASNGCGGTLSCGGCGGGMTCATGGICVDVSSPPPASSPSPPQVGDADRPWAHNTGPTNPGALSPSGSMTVTTNGAVVENVDVRGTITIQADNVTIRNFRIDAAGNQYGINIGSSHRGIVIEDGEIFGMESAGILGYGVTVRRLYVHDSGGDALKIAGGPSLVEYCFIEKVGKSPDAHADGNQTRGGANITFRYNNIYMPFQGTPNSPGAPYKSNAAFMLELGISNFVIENNWLNGGTYTIYCPSPEKGGVYIRNNIFGRDNGGWSEGKDEYRLRAGNCAEWSGNRWEDTGELTTY